MSYLYYQVALGLRKCHILGDGVAKEMHKMHVNIHYLKA